MKLQLKHYVVEKESGSGGSYKSTNYELDIKILKQKELEKKQLS